MKNSKKHCWLIAIIVFALGILSLFLPKASTLAIIFTQLTLIAVQIFIWYQGQK